MQGQVERNFCLLLIESAEFVDGRSRRPRGERGSKGKVDGWTDGSVRNQSGHGSRLSRGDFFFRTGRRRPTTGLGSEGGREWKRRRKPESVVKILTPTGGDGPTREDTRSPPIVLNCRPAKLLPSFLRVCRPSVSFPPRSLRIGGQRLNKGRSASRTRRGGTR